MTAQLKYADMVRLSPRRVCVVLENLSRTEQLVWSPERLYGMVLIASKP